MGVEEINKNRTLSSGQPNVASLAFPGRKHFKNTVLSEKTCSFSLVHPLCTASSYHIFNYFQNMSLCS